MSDDEQFATLWDFISSDPFLTYAEKILYSIILSYSAKEGHCWATNMQLMDKMGIPMGSQRVLQDFLSGLKSKSAPWLQKGLSVSKILF